MELAVGKRGQIVFEEGSMLVPRRKRIGTLCSIGGVCSLLFLLGWIHPGVLVAQTSSSQCAATQPDIEGPFYKPNAPVRTQTGRGLEVSGRVRSVLDCRPLKGARIEWWSADAAGDYKDEHRATVVTDKDGRYRYETVSPSGYSFRPPHLHVKVSAVGHRTLTTQVYPERGQKKIVFNFNLVTE